MHWWGNGRRWINRVLLADHENQNSNHHLDNVSVSSSIKFKVGLKIGDVVNL